MPGAARARLNAGPSASRPRWLVVAALGTAQTLAWASSYYLAAILAAPMAASFGHAPSLVFGLFSAGLLLMAVLGPVAGRAIDRWGGRPVLAASSLVFAGGLGVLAVAPNLLVLGLGWALLGVGMAVGLYDAAFAALAGLYGHAARGPITGITLIAGFASTVGWPVSTLLLDSVGWRGACAGWAVLHLVLGLPLNRLLLPPTPRVQPAPADAEPVAATGERRAMVLLAFAFAATWIVSAALAAHLPAVLHLAGAGANAAVAAAALVGPAQVAARLAEFTLFRRLHPLRSARFATALHPAAALLLGLLGAPAVAAFAVLHGVGNGMLTIAKGTLPLALFGPAGYGLRTGLLSAPARLTQAAAPLGFAWAIEAWGLHALWITAGLSLSGLAALFALRRAG